MRWTATLIGRNRGAIGIFYPMTTTVEGDTEEQAQLNLYERYEHLSHLRLTPEPVRSREP